MQYFVYIVKAADNTLYTGFTTNIDRRILNHNLKKGSKILRGKLPVVLVYSENFNDKPSALKREIEIKSWSRKKKLEIIRSFNKLE